MCVHNHLNNNPVPRDEDSIHSKEHALWNRRSFLQALGLVGGGTMLLGTQTVSATKATPLSVALANNDNDRILVIIRLDGGNDGLNTIVPIYDYDTYANLRPTIRHHENNLLRLDDSFGIPNYMDDLISVWGEGNMKIVHGVGYPEQNLSHFRSTNIWASVQDETVEPTGWWGRYFEELYPDYLINPPEVPPAVQIGNVGNLIFDGANSNYAFSMANIEQLQNVAENGTLHDVVNSPGCVYGDKLLFMRATANTTLTYSKVIQDAYSEGVNQVEYGSGDLAKQLASVARLIKGRLSAKVYLVSLGSFDTHANQLNRHQNLLQDLSSSIKAFYDDLEIKGMDDEVLSMTISEFGRRPYENGSDGTDHGAASPIMLFGSGLNGSGFVGTHPDLSTWDSNDNLIPTTHFQDVYSSILSHWFCLDKAVIDSVLLSNINPKLNLGFFCKGSTQATSSFKHAAVYTSNGVYIQINLDVTRHIEINLYDMLGRNIGTLANQIFFQGKHSIHVEEAIGQKLSMGQYIYRISMGEEHFSKTFIFN